MWHRPWKVASFKRLEGHDRKYWNVHYRYFVGVVVLKLSLQTRNELKNEILFIRHGFWDKFFFWGVLEYPCNIYSMDFSFSNNYALESTMHVWWRSLRFVEQSMSPVTLPIVRELLKYWNISSRRRSIFCWGTGSKTAFLARILNLSNVRITATDARRVKRREN